MPKNRIVGSKRVARSRKSVPATPDAEWTQYNVGRCESGLRAQSLMGTMALELRAALANNALVLRVAVVPSAFVLDIIC
jgi:hypothetical protein